MRSPSARRSSRLLTVAACGSALAVGVPVRADDAPKEPLGSFRVLGDAPAASLIPADADGGVAVRDPGSGVGVVATFTAASPSPGQLVGATTTFAGAFGAESSLVLTTFDEGVTFDLKAPKGPPVLTAAWRLELEGTSGLRAVGGVVELLDAAGVPRIRIAPDAIQSHTLDLGACAHDDAPAPPWGRPATAPGAGSCDATLVTLGALARLRIETTARAIRPRFSHATTLLSADDEPARVLVSGGLVGGSLWTESAELFDMTTATWAAGPPMATLRMRHTATRLPDGRVLVVGGATDPAAPTTELFDAATGWTPGPALLESRRDHAATLVGDAVLVTGGVGADELPLASAERLTADAAAPLAPMDEARSSHTATALSDGRVLVVGGIASGGVVTANAELWDGVAWRAAGSTGGRVEHVACPLSSGDVFVAGGQLVLNPPEGIADASRAALRFDAASSAFSPLPDMPSALTAAAWAPVGSTCLLAGGAAHAGALAEPVADARLLDETATAVLTAGPMVVERRFHTATSLPGARALVVGGAWLAFAPLGSVELFEGICVDEHTAPDAEREPVDCSPYACSAGACRTSCETVLDCAQGTVCDASKCVPPPGAAQFGGCDCSVSAGAGAAPSGWVWAALVALAARLSGRRSCRSPAASRPRRGSARRPRSTARSRGRGAPTSTR